jgi:hypothetical protein
MPTPSAPRRRQLFVAVLIAIAVLGSTIGAEASVPGKPFTQTECEGHSDSVARLYTAGLGRVPDEGGFEYWMDEYTSGRWSFPRMAQFFVGSAEFVEAYPALNDPAFVAQLYRNVLDRDGEPSGVLFWSAEMAAGMSRATVLMRFAESPENIQRSGTTSPALGSFNEGISGPWTCIGTLPAVPRPVAGDLTISELLGVVRVADEELVDYARSDWDHWSDLDNDGCDTRCEVLQDEMLGSIPALGGAPGYVSIYDLVVFSTSDTSSMDLDHVVALSEAARSGGQAWPPSEKEAFANDLGWSGSLVLVSASSNRSKGDRDPADWLPPVAATDPVAGCQYLEDWLSVKYRWDLTIDPQERSAIIASGTLMHC